MTTGADPMRDGATAIRWVDLIRRRVTALGRPLRLMEVCGTHTVAISQSGIRSVLAGYVDLVSGPGCPVCVTADAEIDRMLAYCEVPRAILLTYGDLLRVPGSHTSLAGARATGADVRVLYSPLDAIPIAEQAPDRPVIFLGIGFETTTPASALLLQMAEERGIRNLYIHNAHKLTPPAMRALLAGGGVRLDGFICPGHVSTILGEEGFAFLASEFGMPAAIAGFEPLDILLAVAYLADAALGRQPVALQNNYSRWVPPEGNPRARALMARYFALAPSPWRGLGTIPESGLRLASGAARFDADRAFPAELPEPRPKAGCRCGEVLRGEIRPPACPLFGRPCRPESPHGPCMVSSEGACAAYYRYGEGESPVPAESAEEVRP